MARRTARGAEAIDATTPILIFGLSRGMFHHGALGIARSAGRLGIPVHRICQESWAPAACSRYSRGWRAIPADPTDDQILHTLRGVSDDIGRCILIPVDDASSGFVDDHAAELRADFLFPEQPAGLARALASKREMFQLCRQYDIPTPMSVFPASETELLRLAEPFDYPIVVKCINAADAPPASPRVKIAENRDELLSAYRAMESPRAHNVMLQEYIPGTPEAVWMFNGYFDVHSECRVGFTGRKIRQSPPYTGVTTLGVCLPCPNVLETTIRFMKALGYRGILDIGYRFDHRDGQYKLLDVNPRIGGTFRLFVDDTGVDVLRALYLDLTGQEVPTNTSPDGRRWVVEPHDLASSFAYWRRGDITPLDWIRSFQGVREAAWFALDDPLPFLALLAQLLLRRLPSRILRR